MPDHPHAAHADHPGATILTFGGKTPVIHPSAFIAPGARIIGDVEIGPDSSIWYNCVVRGDVNAIRIGARTNIQDGSVIHCDDTNDATRNDATGCRPTHDPRNLRPCAAGWRRAGEVAAAALDTAARYGQFGTDVFMITLLSLSG